MLSLSITALLNKVIMDAFEDDHAEEGILVI